MKTRDFKKLIEKQDTEITLEEYMKGKHSKLTEKQIQKLIDNKKPGNKEHGAIIFKYKKVVKN